MAAVVAAAALSAAATPSAAFAETQPQVESIDFGDGKHQRRRLRPALPDGIGADNCGGGQSEAQRP